MDSKKSFTLIELLVVIAIIGILSSLVIARFSDWGDNARIANTLQWSAGVHRTLGANLVGHWPLNGDVNDISGYGNHGTMYGFTGDPDDYWLDGVPGSGNQALKFDGNDYVDCGDNTSLDISGDHSFSIGAWVYPISTRNDGCIVSYGSSENGRVISFVTNLNNKIKSVHYANDYSFATSWKLNQWQYIIIAYNSTTSVEKLYVDGNYKEQWSPSNLNLNISDKLQIGKATWNNIYFNTGSISDVRIYNTALTAEEVGRIYAETKDQYLAYE